MPTRAYRRERIAAMPVADALDLVKHSDELAAIIAGDNERKDAAEAAEGRAGERERAAIAAETRSKAGLQALADRERALADAGAALSRREQGVADKEQAAMAKAGELDARATELDQARIDIESLRDGAMAAISNLLKKG